MSAQLTRPCHHAACSQRHAADLFYPRRKITPHSCQCRSQRTQKALYCTRIVWKILQRGHLEGLLQPAAVTGASTSGTAKHRLLAIPRVRGKKNRGLSPIRRVCRECAPGILTFETRLERPPSGLEEVQTPAHPFTAKAGLKPLPPSAYPSATIEALPPHHAIARSISSRVRPLVSSTATCARPWSPFSLAPDAAEGTAGRSSKSGVVHSCVL